MGQPPTARFSTADAGHGPHVSVGMPSGDGTDSRLLAGMGQTCAGQVGSDECGTDTRWYQAEACPRTSRV
eukprot:1770866-Rhodomonas_salina.1